MKQSLLLGLLLHSTICTFVSHSQNIEEYNVHGPMEFHDHAMKEFVAVRREDPNATFEYDSPFMKRARAHAVKRLAIQAEEELSLRVSWHLDWSVQ